MILCRFLRWKGVHDVRTEQELKDLGYRTELISVTKQNAIDQNLIIGNICKFRDLARGFAKQKRYPGVGEFFPNSAQCRQTKHDIAELAEMNYENVFEFGVKFIQANILQYSEVGAGHFHRFFDS